MSEFFNSGAEMFYRVICVVCILVLHSTIAQSQDIATGGGNVVLYEAQTHERTVSGQLDACEMTYLIAFEDHIYRRGDIVFLRGAFSLNGVINRTDKAPFITFKVTAFDVVNDKPVRAPIYYAYIVSNGISYANKEFTKFACEDGGYCTGYELMANPELAVVGQSGLSINFNRHNGGSDVQVPVNFMRDKPQETANFAECSSKLINAIIKKFGR